MMDILTAVASVGFLWCFHPQSDTTLCELYLHCVLQITALMGRAEATATPCWLGVTETQILMLPKD